MTTMTYLTRTSVLLGLALSLVSCAESTGPEAPVLIASREEPAGEHCVSGGSAIEAGRDASGDGVLDVEEVETTTYVCRPANGRVGDTIEGSVSVWNQDDVTTLAGVTTITGDLIIEADGVAMLAFADLVTVGGSIRATGASSIGTLSFPALTTVDAIRMIREGGDETAHDIDVVSFPVLTTCPDELSIAATERIDLGALVTAGVVELVVDAPSAGSSEIVIGSLTTASVLRVITDGAPSQPIALTALTEVTGLIDIVTPGSVALAALATAGGDFTVSATGTITASALGTVAGHVAFTSTGSLMVAAPLLTSVGSLRVASGVTSLSLPLLATIMGSVDGAQGLRVVGSSLVTASFPSLGYVYGSVELDENTSLTTVSLGILSSIAGPGVGLYVTENPVLPGLSLPALTFLSGRVTITNNAVLATLALGANYAPTSTVVIGANPMLSQCTVDALEQAWLAQGFLDTFMDYGNLVCAP